MRRRSLAVALVLCALPGLASAQLQVVSTAPALNAVASVGTASWLVHKLDGTQDWFTAECAGMFCGSQMPLGGPYLPVGQRDAIRAWISGGAANDCP